MTTLFQFLSECQITSDLAAKDAAQQVVDAVLEDGDDALPLFVAMKGLEACFEIIRKQLRYKAIEEARDVPSYKGVKIRVGEVGAKWHYDKCGDPTYQTAKETIKERENFLKSLKSPLDMVTEDGEVIKVFPPYKTSTTSPIIELQKAAK